MARIPMSTPRAARAQLAKQIRGYLRTPENGRDPIGFEVITRAFSVLLRFLELEGRQQHDLLDEIRGVQTPSAEKGRIESVREAVAEIVATGNIKKAQDIVDRAIAAGVITERTPIFPGDLSDIIEMVRGEAENGRQR